MPRRSPTKPRYACSAAQATATPRRRRCTTWPSCPSCAVTTSKRAGGSRRALSWPKEAGRPDVVALSRHSLGLVMTVGGDPGAGLAHHEASLGYFRASGDRFQTAWTLSGIGLALRRSWDAARRGKGEIHREPQAPRRSQEPARHRGRPGGLGDARVDGPAPPALRFGWRRRSRRCGRRPALRRP